MRIRKIFGWRRGNEKSHNERFRYGSAGFAKRADLKTTGLLGGDGLHIGFDGETPIRLSGDASLVTFAGAGSGKLRDVLGFVVCGNYDRDMVILDPRGELYEISWHVLARHGCYAYSWNPMGMHGRRGLPLNALDFLTPNSVRLHADIKAIVDGLIPLTNGGEAGYFSRRAREFLEVFIKWLVERDGGVSFPSLYRFINLIESDVNAWLDQLERMLKSRHADVRRVAAEAAKKQAKIPKEFSGIIGEIYGHLSFLSDPTLLAALEDGPGSLADLVDDERPVRFYLNVPAEYLSVWAPVLRVIFIATMVIKSRKPAAKRVLLLIDEAGQLGKFDALLRAYTFGRGDGVQAWAFFQDIGQVDRNLGKSALQSIMGSAQLRQFFGVRDYETAKLVSDMLGEETLAYDAEKDQGEALRRRRKTAQDVLLGGDPFRAANDYAAFKRGQTRRDKQARRLLTPDEVLNLWEGQQVLFVSGRNLKPILAEKHAYFERTEMAGLYLPNPYHPPTDQVRLQDRRGATWAPVRSGPVPADYRGFPQYEGGVSLWVEGFPI